MFSVVLPVRDGERWLDLAIRSVRSQSFDDFELIVVDDGSSDDSASIARGHSDEDERVRVVGAGGVGLAAALNVGLEAARRPWIARLDADDVALPHRLATQAAAVEGAPDVVAWGSWAWGVNADGRRISLISTGPVTREEFHTAHSRGEVIEILHPTMIFRRDLALEIGGYDERLPVAEDIELWDRMGHHGPFLTLPTPLIEFRVHAGSLSTVRLVEAIRVERFLRARRVSPGTTGDLGYETFVAQEEAEPIWRRLLRTLATRGRVAHRRAGIAFAERRLFATVAWTAVSALLNPAYALPAVWRQVGHSAVSGWSQTLRRPR